MASERSTKLTDGDEGRTGGSSRLRHLVRGALIALVPPLVAFLGERMVFESLGSRWLLMVAAVIVSAAGGGILAGLIATITSAALVWWFLVPPYQTFGATDARFYLSVVLFLAIGYAVCLLHERLRRTTERLTRTARENQIFAALIENSLDFVGIGDIDGRATYLNPAGRRMVELPDDVDVQRTRILDYYPPDVRDFARRAIVAEMTERGKWAGETRVRNWRTGASIPVLDTHFLIRDPATRQVVGVGTITRDISAQRAQRDELEQTNQRLEATTRDLAESQRYLQGILDYSPNAIVIKTVAGRYTMVNNGFEEITHLSAAKARGQVDRQLFPESLARRLRANDERALATRQAVVTEETLEVDGRRRVFDVTKFPLIDDRNTIFALCGIWTEITHRKRDEEFLRRAASELRAAQRVAHVGSWRWDLRTGEIEWSDEMYRIFGLEPVRAPRSPMFIETDSTILKPDSKARARAAVEKILADGTPYEVDLEFTRPDGSARWVESRGEVVRDDGGRIVGITGTSADITKLKELQRLRDEWTSVIAHDLRQPISTIVMASSMFSDVRGGELNESERSLVERMRSAAQSLRRMVDDLLDMSLLEADRLHLERKWTNPRTLVNETLERLAHVPGIERVRVREESPLSPVFVDPMRVCQALGNLVSNAIKYGRDATDITVSLRQRADELEIGVSNEGAGIPPDELPRLFDRFMRSRAARGSGVSGLGLGLYIAQGVMRAHGGRLRVESTPGETTTFFAVFPTSAERREAA